MIQNPEQHQSLLDSPDSALTEILRWSSTNAYVQRLARRDFRFADQQIRAGDVVTLWNVSANRDDRQFPQPHRFDITRSPNRYLSYGSGLHRCVGAPLAQIGLTVLFERLVRHRVRFDLAGDVVPLHSNFILGTARLPLTYR
ncbi:MAG: cytochrome P450 [Umezawaea sp.]